MGIQIIENPTALDIQIRKAKRLALLSEIEQKKLNVEIFDLEALRDSRQKILKRN